MARSTNRLCNVIAHQQLEVLPAGDAVPVLNHRRPLPYDCEAVTLSGAELPVRRECVASTREADMEVNGTGPVGGPGSVQPSHLNSADSTPQADFGGLEMPQDEVDISSAARLLDQLNDPQVRAARLAEIKAAIEAGTYETEHKLEAALDKLLTDIRREGL